MAPPRAASPPSTRDKYAKIGIQVCDLFDEDRLRERLTAAVSLKNVLFEHLYHKPSLDVDELFQQLMELREQIRPYVGDAVTFVHEALKEGKTVLLEGQLGSMKDPDLGIFPMTTSSHTLAGFGCVGAAVPPTAVEDVICVTKAYSSSVGSNTEPFVSEVLGEAGDELRRRGGDKGEFGATTGRPRRVGWFDAVATKYGCMVQGATQVALTCLDVLGYLDEIPVCTGYEIDGDSHRPLPHHPGADAGQARVHHAPRLEVRHPGLHRLPGPASAGKGLCGLPGVQDRRIPSPWSPPDPSATRSPFGRSNFPDCYAPDTRLWYPALPLPPLSIRRPCRLV